MKKVFIAVPTWNGTIPVELMANLVSMRMPEGYEKYFGYTKRTMVDVARNMLANGFLQQGYDYLFFVDDDTIPAVDTLEQMIKLDKDIVGVPVPARANAGEDRLCMYGKDKSGQLNKLKKARKIFACGMSCTLIKRKVVEALAKKYDYPFDFQVIKGVKYHEDINFCRKANLLGFEVWATPLRVNPYHIGNPIAYTYEQDGIKSLVLP